MSTQTQSTYTAAADETFVWASSDTDSFSREHIAFLAKAVANHTHEAGRGLAVKRVDAGAVGTAGLVDDAVTAAKLADHASNDALRAVTADHIRAGAVTTTKLADGACTGAKLGSDVVAADGATLTNVTINSGTLGAGVNVAGQIGFGEGSDVASASSITLPSDGNTVRITGAASIATIAARPAGTPAWLLFSGAAKVLTTGNVKLQGVFWGQANAALHLISDGTNWVEVGRSGHVVPSARLYRSTNQALTSGLEAIVAYNAADADIPDTTGLYNVGTANGSIQPTVGGLYLISAAAEFTQNTNQARRLGLYKNGSLHRWLADAQANEGDPTRIGGTATVRVNGSTDVLTVRAYQDTGTINLIGGLASTYVELRWVAP